MRLKNTADALRVFSIVALALVSFSLFNIVLFHWQNRGQTEIPATHLGTDLDLTIDKTLDLATLPDIYYVILDGYGQADMLQSVYGYDNTAFIEELRIEPAVPELAYIIIQPDIVPFISTRIRMRKKQNRPHKN